MTEWILHVCKLKLVLNLNRNSIILFLASINYRSIFLFAAFLLLIDVTIAEIYFSFYIWSFFYLIVKDLNRNMFSFNLAMFSRTHIKYLGMIWNLNHPKKCINWVNYLFAIWRTFNGNCPRNAVWKVRSMCRNFSTIYFCKNS